MYHSKRNACRNNSTLPRHIWRHQSFPPDTLAQYDGRNAIALSALVIVRYRRSVIPQLNRVLFVFYEDSSDAAVVAPHCIHAFIARI